ncbi:MAG: hypothetical protein IPJ89_02980 [Candidatus Iainarchaeum archaeon]|uniref:Uncharacterized protein n=1 Tax=Candidatus Iainarchaeum sp. TaxID=3101447 RepID=A0A7T9I1A1_9ARCH|nr:MAG: hypothetical protein IPJ89_02980 [Candidatus Diapherotrites archaeon]
MGIESIVLGIIFALCLAVIGSRWFNALPRTWERVGMGLLAMILLFPALLYFSSRLLGWKFSLPTLLICFFIFLIVGKIVSKNLRI